jgi:hypothetical protein
MVLFSFFFLHSGFLLAVASTFLGPLNFSLRLNNFPSGHSNVLARAARGMHDSRPLPPTGGRLRHGSG